MTRTPADTEKTLRKLRKELKSAKWWFGWIIEHQVEVGQSHVTGVCMDKITRIDRALKPKVKRP